MFRHVERQFYIESLGYPLERRFDRNFRYEGESHDFTEMVYVEEGQMEVVENENIYILRRGNMIIHAPSEFHKLCSASEGDSVVYNLSGIIKGRIPSVLFEGVFHLDEEERMDFLSIFRRARCFIEAEKESSFSGQEIADSLSIFLMKLCRKNRPNKTLSGDSTAQRFRKLVCTMQEHLDENMSLEDIAKINNVSVSYIKTLFYRYTDTAPKTYYARLRLIRAGQLVKSGIPFSVIAEKMNFSSVNHFSVFFKKNMGITPSQYRQEMERDK
ncbi:MAG: helix-turn-helix domain-containing protein [Ruminococcaceae bacterium]|nr:helix-turn-helix domain-containing protein [Oscillospiraceae bacterium]